MILAVKKEENFKVSNVVNCFHIRRLTVWSHHF